MVVAWISGVWAFLSGSPRIAWVVTLHGAAGIAVALLTPWKRVIIGRGLRRGPGKRLRSVVLLGAVVTVIGSGVVHSSGVIRVVGTWSPMGIHVASAVLVVPFLAAHVIARPQRVRRVDLGRRTVLRGLTLGGLAVVAQRALDGTYAVFGLAGADRRFSGSHEVASFDPARLPVVQWLDDDAPRVDVAAWTLRVDDRVLTYAELTSHADVVDATLDCTGGWYSHQRWVGVPLDRLLAPGTRGRSLVVRSSTGYARRFPLDEADRLFLAWGVGDRPLSRGHGFPVRLVAPGRRGVWWVKWVEQIESSDRPGWWQLPVPLT
jgi:DMSO/TMAO reductase YedYZ molybdopterin-dependent catalytic subunit